MKKLKVIIVNQHMSQALGGSELQCDLVAKGLLNLGHSVTYLSPCVNAIDVASYPYEIVRVNKSLPRLIEATLAQDPDVIYWRFNKKHFLRYSRAMARYRVPIVFAASHINDLMPWATKSLARNDLAGSIVKAWRSMVARVNHIGLRNVEALITNNKDFLTLSSIRRSFYVPNGCNEDRTSFFWPRPYVTWVSNIKASKRPEAVLEVAELLKPLGIDFLLVGAIQSSEYQWISDPGWLPSNVCYLGTRCVPEVNGILAGSHMHIHTCETEGFPNVFIQAWMQGRITISLEVDPCGYIQEYGIGSVAGGDIKVFANQIADWLGDMENTQRAGRVAKVFAEKTFSTREMVKQVESILLGSVVDARPGG